MARPPGGEPTSAAEPARAEGAAAWLRPTALAAFITAMAALIAAAYPLWKDWAQRAEAVVDTQSGRVSALNFGCSETMEVDTSQARTLRLEVGTGRYPVSMQVFFKTDLADIRSFQMFPLPTSQSTLNPMNIYTDGSAVLLTLIGGQPLYARYDPVVNEWDEFSQGYIYACALF